MQWFVPKLSLGSSASGSLFPTVIIFAGLSNEEIPDESFMVCSIPGLTVNAQLDICKTTNLGYIYFTRSGVKQIFLIGTRRLLLSLLI